MSNQSLLARFQSEREKNTNEQALLRLELEAVGSELRKLQQECVKREAALREVRDGCLQWEDETQVCDKCGDSAGHYLLRKTHAIIDRALNKEER